MIDLKQLVKAGVHFGHQTSRWCPKMAPYIWGFKNKAHLIDVSKTAYQIEKAVKFLESVAAEGKPILWIGTKKAAQKVVLDAAIKLDMPYVIHRWIGGTLSNNSQVKKSLTKLLHYEDILAKSEKFPHYTKKELNVFQKIINRLERSIGGIRNLTWPIGAVVVVDVNKERSAVREAATMGIPIPIVAVVDTNADPSSVDYVIPANDDSPQSIGLIIDHLAQAVQKGKEMAAKAVQEKQAKAEQEKKEKEIAKEQEKDKAAPKPVKVKPKKIVEKKEVSKEKSSAVATKAAKVEKKTITTTAKTSKTPSVAKKS